MRRLNRCASNKALQPTPSRFAGWACSFPLLAAHLRVGLIARSGWLSLTFGFHTMSEILPWTVALVAILLILQFVSKALNTARSQSTSFRYVSRQSLYTAPELQFLEVLRQVIPRTFTVTGKVRLADIVEPAKIHKNKEYIRAFNKISSKHVDFVICNRLTYDIIAVIELDDSSHRLRSRQQRDILVDEIMTGAQIPIRHIRQSKHYNPDDLRVVLEPLLAQPETTSKRNTAEQGAAANP